MIRTLILASAVALALVNTSAAHASECKGLANDVCIVNPVCGWRPAMVAGETLTKAGTPAKRSAKAHCHILGKRQQEAKAAAPKQ